MPMRKALIIDQEDINTFAEIRHAVVTMGATVVRYRKKTMKVKDAFEEIAKQIEKADEALSRFWSSGL